MKNFGIHIKYKRSTFCFFVAYTLLIVYRILKSSTLGIDDKGVTYIIVCALFLAHILTIKANLKRLLISVCVAIVVIFYIIRTFDPVIPVVTLALIASKDIEFKTIVRQSLSIMVSMVLLIVVLSLLGVLKDNVSYRTLSGTVVACHGVGFNHSSALPTYYCFIFMGYYYLKNRRVSLFNALCWLLGGYLIYSFCAERLRFYMLFIIALFMLIEPIAINRYEKVKIIIMTLIYPITALSSILLGYFYNPTNPIMYDLNIFLSNRLYFQNYSFKNLAIPLFGQRIAMGDGVLKNLENTYFYIDSAYTYVLFSYGIIISILLIIAYVYGSRKSCKFNNYRIMVCFFIMAIDSVVGNQLLSIWSIPILFYPFCREDTRTLGKR